MRLQLLDEKILWFPPVQQAQKDGLLAIGGDLSEERLLLAYRSGIFPWFNEDEPPLWWSPDPRCVLFPSELKISSSMRPLLRKKAFEFRINSHFEGVMRGCQSVPRPGQDGTWITEDIIDAYLSLHHKGYAWSAEVWQEGQLAGGLYGILLGRVFFGESMFARVSNASKYAFICWVEALKQKGVVLIDCQVHTPHLESLGARMIPRNEFIRLLDTHIQ